MDNPWRIIFKALSNPNYSIKDNYEFHRKAITAARPYFKPLYNMIDKKIVTAKREIPIRIFKPKTDNKILNINNGNNNKGTNKTNGKNDSEDTNKTQVKKKSKLNDIIIFFHGGGWVTGNIDNYTSICGNMANQSNCIVISVSYSLAPEYPFPEGLEDCYNVTKIISTI